MANRPVIAGNWKMFGSPESVSAFAAGLRTKLAGTTPKGDLVICPPATLIAPFAQSLQGLAVGIGGQDCHAAKTGAHTGDVAAPMIADAGGSWVIVGHSERRAAHHETDAMVAAKAAAAHAAGLTAIICVGESEQQRKADQQNEIVAAQISGSLPPGATAANTLVAYEPIWAIGTGLIATATEIRAMHAHLRNCLAGKVDQPAAMRLLYGGSVKGGNAAEILAIANVDGVLVGGASLDLEDFWKIALSCP